MCDMSLRCCWFKPQRRHCVVSLSKTLYPLLSPGSTQEIVLKWLKIVDWDGKHQLEKEKKKYSHQICSLPDSTVTESADSEFSSL